MPEHLVIRLRSDGDQEATWLVVDGFGRRVGDTARGTLTDAAAQAPQRRVTVLVPGTDVLLARVRLPVRTAGKLLRALPYSLEEQLAEDVEALHFAAARPDADGTVLAAVVSRRLMDDWLQRLQTAGLSPHALCSDVQALPVNPGSLTLVLEAHRIHCSPPDDVPRVFEGLTVAQVMQILDSDGNAPGSRRPGHLLVYCEAHHDRHLNEYWNELREAGREVDVHLLPDGALGRMASGAVSQPAVNLLQGDYAPGRSWEPLLRPWRTAAALAAALAIVALGAKSIEHLQLRQAVDRLDDEIAAVFRDAFGDIPVSDYRLQARQQLARLRAGGADPQLLETLLVLGGALADADSTRLLAISYRQGVMDLRLRAPDVDTLDRIQRDVTAAGGIRSQIQAANPVEGGVEGRLQLTRGGA